MVTADDALHLTPREVAQVEAALDDGIPQLSLAQWYATVSKALHAHDVKAAAGLIGLMALQHPAEADELRSMILLVSKVAP